MSTGCGRVTGVNGNLVYVESDVGGGCSSCGASAFCRVKEAPVKKSSWMKNSAGASEGDLVEYETKTGHVILIAALHYILPVTMLAAGAIAGSQSALSALAGITTDAAAALTGTAGLFAGLAAGFLVSMLLRRKGILITEVIRVNAGSENRA